MKKVLIYRGALFERSEPFIHYQVKALIEIADVYLLSHHYINEKYFLLPKEIVKTKIPQKPLNIIERIEHLIARKLSGNENRFVPKANKITKELIRANSLTIVHAHFGNNALRILPLVKELNLKLVVSFHGFDASKLLNDNNYTKHLPSLFENCTKVILCADFMFENLKSFGLKKEQTEVIPYGVDVKKIDSIKPDVIQNCFSIIHSGRLAKKKGVPDLVRAFIKLVEVNPTLNVRLTIIGSGDDLEEVNQLIEGSDNSIQSKIEMLGAMSHLQLLAKLKSADLFILNSRIDEQGDSEGFPNSILEAMAANVAVISTRHAGIPTIIENNFNGILVDEKDTNSLIKAMSNIIHNPLLREEMVRNAYKTVSSEYTIEGMNRKIQSVFNSI